jgi:hypothetical protein
MKKLSAVEIKCETKDRLNIAEMTELQGTLKARTDIDYDKIKLSIIKYGFCHKGEINFLFKVIQTMLSVKCHYFHKLTSVFSVKEVLFVFE